MPDEIIVSTKEQIGDYDAIETAKPDEPLFPLQGGDPHAPPCILLWAELRRKEALNESDPELREAGLKKATAAELVAFAFDEYRAGHAPAPEVPTNSQGIKNTAEDDHLSNMVRLVRVLDNAIADVADVGEKLPMDKMLARGLLDGAIVHLRQAAELIEPRRHLRTAPTPT